MADEKNYNETGFKKDGDGAVFGNTEEGGGAVSDYDSWDWKQIMAAIFGMSAGVQNEENLSRARGIASPQSLQDAANAFYQVQQTLEAVAQSLADQSKALAGEGGPWQGAAAEVFLDTVTRFSRQVQAAANVLSGGAGGGNSVPQQLANNAVNLRNAQVKIQEIDRWYARQAQLAGVKAMSNGLIPVSQRPQIVEMMNRDMRAVLKSLAGEYQITTDTVRNPDSLSSLGPNRQPSLDPPPRNKPIDMSSPPPLKKFTPPEIPGSSIPQPSSFRNGTSTSDPNNKFADIPASDPSTLDNILNPETMGAFGGGAGVGGGAGGLGGMPMMPGMPMTPGRGGGAGGEPTDASGLLDPSAEPWAGDAGVDAGSGAGVPGGGSRLDLPGAGGAPSPEAFGGGAGVGGGAGGLGGMPMMPGMPMTPGRGGGAGGAGGAGGEPTDASGLLDPSAEPWAGAPEEGDRGASYGAPAGGPGLTLPGCASTGAEGGARPGNGADAPAATGTGGAAAEAGEGGPAMGMPMPMPFIPDRSGDSRRDDERSDADASALLEGEGTEWGGTARRPSEGCEADSGVVTGGAVTAQGTGADSGDGACSGNGAGRGPGTGTGPANVSSISAGPEEGLPDDRVGVPRLESEEDEEEDTAAWDAGTAMFTPLLWATRRKREEDEDEIFEPGYSSKDRRTWGTGEFREEDGTEDGDETEETAEGALASEGEAVTPEEPEPGPRMATWQPTRAAGSTGAMLSGADGPAELGWGFMSAMDEVEEEEEEDEDTEEEAEDEETAKPREIVDLLLQENSAWGTLKRDGDSLI